MIQPHFGPLFAQDPPPPPPPPPPAIAIPTALLVIPVIDSEKDGAIPIMVGDVGVKAEIEVIVIEDDDDKDG